MGNQLATIEADSMSIKPSGDLIAFARSADELQMAQGGLTEWATQKLQEARQHYEHMEANLTQARSYNWALQGFTAAVREARKRVEFYEKLHAAFAAGYCIVPEFPIDIFAVRTARMVPPKQHHEADRHWRDVNRAVESENLPVGVGEYVNKDPLTMERKFSVPEDPANPTGPKKTMFRWWNESFQDVDFPYKTASIQVLDATGQAMARQIFDEIGILPARRVRNADPMVIGRINFKEGSKRRSVSFVIAWFLRESDLTV